MRPRRLELEGFTVFRQPVTVDFAGADLFALAGPTGAGKTSLIDAITFALYGTVPRLDRRAVAPVISQNLTEARVRLDFAIGDDLYTAVRVVRAGKAGGATTKEARLERAGTVGAPAAPPQVLAGTADEVTEAVTALLGLTYDHFTTCVSLPQGQFARFLHDKPKDRQDLLVRLLGLGIYDRVATAARQQAALAKSRGDVLGGRLTQLAEATTEARDEARARVAELEALADKLAAALPDLDRLADQLDSARRAAADQADGVRLLEDVEPPAGVTELAGAVAAAVEERARLVDAEQSAADRTADAEATAATLPARRWLESRRDDLRRRDDLVELREKGRRAAREADEAVRSAAAAEAAAEDDRRSAAAALERVRVEERAQALVPELAVGEPCPVCRQSVVEVPAVASPPTAAAEAAVAEADRAARDAAGAHRKARDHQVRVDEKLAKVEHDLSEVAARLDGDDADDRPDLATVERLLADVAQAERAVEQARQAERSARKRRVDHEAHHDRLIGQEAEARRAFDAARDRLAVLRPPVFDRQNLADDWAGLVDWASEQRPALAAAADRERARAEEIRQEHERRHRELVELCRAAGVEVTGPVETGPGADGVPSGETLSRPVAVARARADDAVRRIESDLADAERLRREQREATEQRQVAEALAEHLKANRFEKWLLDEAVAGLAAAASDILAELSGGAYALSVDPKNGGFTVVDHANASQVRPARTLSGGETFLASLALALGLADQVAELATGGTARLEALFLDEGFGTLDADTLDVVATALDELGARGRMVGIVTHVRELAERLPVRFEIRKVGAAAGVDRVEGR